MLKFNTILFYETLYFFIFIDLVFFANIILSYWSFSFTNSV